MVSVVLLTTEDVLKRNGFWYRLDTVWVTEEMEPFEEVKPEDLFMKPLSRDVYYAKFPDIPRSESEDENPLSLTGFKKKHREWKTKLHMRRFAAQRRDLTNCQATFRLSESNRSINKLDRRVTSLVEMDNKNQGIKQILPTNNQDRVHAFFKRLLESVPPPPVEDLQDNSTESSDIEILNDGQDYEDIDVPDYTDFAKIDMFHSICEQNVLPVSSTLKKSQRQVSFDMNNFRDNSEEPESWYDSIYGLSNIDTVINGTKAILNTKIQNVLHESIEYECFPSWSEIINECGISDSIVRSKESLVATEEIIAQSHFDQTKTIHSFQDEADDGLGYARFAIYKIHQTIQLDGKTTDSSSLHDLKCDDVEDFGSKTTGADKSFYETMYRLLPEPHFESHESVNNVNSAN